MLRRIDTLRKAVTLLYWCQTGTPCSRAPALDGKLGHAYVDIESGPMTLELTNPDLAADPSARHAVKDETVSVEFALGADALVSAVGINRYLPGDALITGSTGDRWCVSRDRFDAKYDPLPGTIRGEAGLYRNRPVTVLAKRMETPFTVARTAGGDVLHGDAGDWLVQYAPGDHGIVERTRFERVYRLAIGKVPCPPALSDTRPLTPKLGG